MLNLGIILRWIRSNLRHDSITPNRRRRLSHLAWHGIEHTFSKIEATLFQLKQHTITQICIFTDTKFVF